MDDKALRATALLDEATRGLVPDVERLVAGAVTRGRRRRRHHQVGTALAAAAVVGVAGVAVGLSPAVRGAGDRAVDAPAVSSPSPDPAPVRRIGFDPGKGAAVLESLLPEGEVSHAETWGSDGEEPRRGARLLLDGGEVLMILGRPAPGLDGDTEQRCRVLAGAGCAVLDDGSWLAAVAGDSDGDTVRDRTIVHLVTPDGWILQVSAGVGVGGRAPVLTRGELTRIATDPVWFDEQQ
jgi:hypothetical protein